MKESSLVRAKAPLRIGLAGGGTDTSPYAETYGGAVLNVTVNLYAYASIEPVDEERITLHAADRKERISYDLDGELPLDGRLDVLKGVYNRVLRDFDVSPRPFRLTTHVDAPPGSGLGTSSTLMVAVLGAFAEWLGLPLGEYDMAHLAYKVERIDLGMAGGRQDQYAATFGGVNFMEFHGEDAVIVNPLRVHRSYLHELANNLLHYHMGTSRFSSAIIDSQAQNFEKQEKGALEGMHHLKEQAYRMKEAVLKGRFDEVGGILDFGWRFKKKPAAEVSNEHIDAVYETALGAGATGGKVSGAGGGGYMVLYCPANARHAVIEAVSERFSGRFERYEFAEHGRSTWTA